jgi:ornithine cyclodeaminase
MTIPLIGPEVEPRLDWLSLTRALEAGHRMPRAETRDTVLRRGGDTMLSRAAWIDGLGMLVKTATVFPGNARRGLPTIGGAASVFDDRTGALAAMVDFALLTRWKTAGDSLLGALRLADPGAREVLIVGAGTVAASLRAAYAAGFPGARFSVWARDPAKARAFAEAHGATAAPDLAEAVTRADIVTCATMATEPVIRGDWLRPGQHLDLIGAYRADMREADDAAFTRSEIFVDSRDTTLDHIGELKDPLARGVIARGDVRADLYDGAALARSGPDAITLYKNGGGAHLDLMTARWMIEAAGAP